MHCPLGHCCPLLQRSRGRARRAVRPCCAVELRVLAVPDSPSHGAVGGCDTGPCCAAGDSPCHPTVLDSALHEWRAVTRDAPGGGKDPGPGRRRVAPAAPAAGHGGAEPSAKKSPGPKAAPPELQEKTLVLAKPGAVQRRLVGSIVQRFERRGFKLVAMKLLQADRGLVDRHYQELRHKPLYPELVAYRTSGPVVAMVWEGHNVVGCTRAMAGDADSVGTIRGDLSVHISRNVVHASDSVETAQREIGFWFQRDKLVDWESKDRDHTCRPSGRTPSVGGPPTPQ